ncbi:unnamed protein product, partial [Lampetra fluviatilis]
MGSRLSRAPRAGSGLTRIYPSHVEAVKAGHIKLEKNKLQTLPADAFNALTELKTLGLNRNSLTILPPGVFYGLNAQLGSLIGRAPSDSHEEQVVSDNHLTPPIPSSRFRRIGAPPPLIRSCRFCTIEFCNRGHRVPGLGGGMTVSPSSSSDDTMVTSLVYDAALLKWPLVNVHGISFKMESNKVFLLLVVCGMTLLVVFLDIHLFTAESLTRPSALTPRIKEQRITQEEVRNSLPSLQTTQEKSQQVNTVATGQLATGRTDPPLRERPLLARVLRSAQSWVHQLLTMAGNANLSRVLSQNDVHVIKNYTRLSQFDAAGQRSRLDGYTVMMFVREPMERLVSAYRDKFVHKNEHYQVLIRRTIMKHYRKNSTNAPLAKGDYVTFPELVRFILDPKRPLWQDVHWLPAHHLCQPCLLRYDFLGKVETVRHDAAALLARVRAPGSLAYTQTPSGRSSATVTDQYLATAQPRDEAEDLRILLRGLHALRIPAALGSKPEANI